MKYQLKEAIEILTRTPDVLSTQLNGLSDPWLHGNEGPETWSPFQVVGHLILNEKTNFLPRVALILSSQEVKTLQPIDMTAHIQMYAGNNVTTLISDFAALRRFSIQRLNNLIDTDTNLQITAIHPKLGEVRLVNILATWVAHDLTHLAQITRVMAKQYKTEIGPFIEFLPKLK
jgi:hypothetical protein